MSEGSGQGSPILPGVFVGAPLPKGVAVAEFDIDGVIGEGGFSVVYLATDRQLKRAVALKEYFPRSLAIRRDDFSVVPSSPRYQEHFDEGLKSFVNEAQLLASFDHPALVKVYRFWEQNRTAYMAMKLYEGPTLKNWLKGRTTPPDEQWILNFASPVMEAVAQLHGQNCLHRDIAPDNILVLDDSFPLLLDFGAARRVIGEATQNLTVILKPGYSPFEQYSEESSLQQGPWTDVYALAAVLYFMVAGKPPPSAVSRVIRDELRPAAEVGAGRYSVELLAAIDKALSVSPDQRPQSMAEFLRLVPQPAGRDDSDTRVKTVASEGGTRWPRPATLPMSSQGGISTPPIRPPVASDTSVRSHHAGSGRKRLSRLVVGAAASVLVVAGYLVADRWKPWREPQLRPKAVTESSRGGAPVPGSATPSLPDGKEMLATSGSAPSGPSGSGEQGRARPTGPHALKGAKLLEAIYELRSREILVTTSARREKGSAPSMSRPPEVSASVAGHLYVLAASTSGDEIYLIFPGPGESDSRLDANQALELPTRTWSEVRTGSSVRQLLIVVSKQRRAFAFEPSAAADSFRRVALTTADTGTAHLRASTSLDDLAPCARGESVCESEFGAVTLAVPPGPAVQADSKGSGLPASASQARRATAQPRSGVAPVLRSPERPAVDENAIERERLQEALRKAQQDTAEANKRAEQATRDAQKAQEERRLREAQAAERERQLRREAEEAAAKQRSEQSGEQDAAKRRPSPPTVVPSF